MNSFELRQELSNAWSREKDLHNLLNSFIDAHYPENKETFKYDLNMFLEHWDHNMWIPDFNYFDLKAGNLKTQRGQ